MALSVDDERSRGEGELRRRFFFEALWDNAKGMIVWARLYGIFVFGQSMRVEMVYALKIGLKHCCVEGGELFKSRAVEERCLSDDDEVPKRPRVSSNKDTKGRCWETRGVRGSVQDGAGYTSFQEQEKERDVV